MLNSCQSNNETSLRNMDYKIENVKVTGDAAIASIKLYRKKQLIFTDCITLLKFKGEWRIVTKIYHAHVANPWEL